MTSTVRELAERIMASLRSRRALAPLTPFGDGPFESELIAELMAQRPPIPDLVLKAALNEAVEWCLAGILEKTPGQDAYELLSSVVLAVRFADVSLDEVGAGEIAAILAHHKTASANARRAVGTLLRTLARTKTPLDANNFESLAESHDRQLRTAALELLGRAGHRSFVPKLAAFLRTEPNCEQLLWTLAHDETAARLIVEGPGGIDRDHVVMRIQKALSDLDPMMRASGRWLDRLKAADKRARKSWGAVNYSNHSPMPAALAVRAEA